ncbi:aminopeptidase N-like [Gigantopelta aegis]|uniref:aminopeptidase N-like n=1 Tax=Gigantopelta aegis TaxID=1735272 RepID=UPI001B88D65F|nr:aminopeptidase N-like [Gigantopelta aegis]
MFDRTDIYGALQIFLTDLARDQYAMLNGDSATDKTPIDRLYRRKMTVVSCSGQNKRCLNDSKHIFTQWMQHNARIDPNLRDVIMCEGVRYSGYREWMYTLSAYETSQDRVDQAYLVAALTCTKEAWLLKR